MEWVNNWAKPKSAMQEYRRLWKERYGDLTVDFDDLRVRVYHSPERRPIRLWMRHVQMERSLQKAVDVRFLFNFQVSFAYPKLLHNLS